MKARGTQGVSFPRSGHAATFHIARLYFGDAFFYCDVDNEKHCGCGAIPCMNPRRTFAKNHDFGLRNAFAVRRVRWLGKVPVFTGFRGEPVLPEERYFIQYRTPVPAIASNFKVYRAKKPGVNNVAGWKKFALRDMAYWNRFIDKWVLNFPAGVHRPLYCSYEDLVAEPERKVGEFLAYLSDGPLDEKRLQTILNKKPISARNSISSFEFYDSGFFRELEEMAGHRMAALGLPSFEVTV